MQHSSDSSHNTPGFGKNTNGLGIFIIAAVFVVLGLSAFYFWRSGDKEFDHYRIEKSEVSEHSDHHDEGSH